MSEERRAKSAAEGEETKIIMNPKCVFLNKLELLLEVLYHWWQRERDRERERDKKREHDGGELSGGGRSVAGSVLLWCWWCGPFVAKGAVRFDASQLD